MSEMEYKTVPLPSEPRKYKGLKDPVDRTSRTMTEILNEEARGGWHFVRIERLEVEVRKGMMRKRDDIDVALAIFGRERADGTRTPSRRVEPQTPPLPDPQPVPDHRPSGVPHPVVAQTPANNPVRED
jgi:hypothetical protein